MLCDPLVKSGWNTATGPESPAGTLWLHRAPSLLALTKSPEFCLTWTFEHGPTDLHTVEKPVEAGSVGCITHGWHSGPPPVHLLALLSGCSQALLGLLCHACPSAKDWLSIPTTCCTPAVLCLGLVPAGKARP